MKVDLFVPFFKLCPCKSPGNILFVNERWRTLFCILGGCSSNPHTHQRFALGIDCVPLGNQCRIKLMEKLYIPGGTNTIHPSKKFKKPFEKTKTKLALRKRNKTKRETLKGERGNEPRETTWNKLNYNLCKWQIFCYHLIISNTRLQPRYHK